jgi:hypothetical protein
MKSGVTSVDIRELSRLVYPWMLGLSILAFWIMASITPVSIVFSQIVKGSQDFFEILPLSGFKKAAGLLIGTNLIYYPLSIISIILTTQYGILADFRTGMQLNVIYFFVTVGLFCNTLSILAGVSSIKLTKRQKNVGGNPLAATIFAVIFLGFPLIGALSNSGHNFFEFDKITLSFYSFKIPIMILFGSIALYLAVWNFLGTARKLTDKTLPFFTRPGAVIYFLSLQFLIFGFFFEYMLNNKSNRLLLVTISSIILFFLMLIISIASLRQKKRVFNAIDRISTDYKTKQIQVQERDSGENISLTENQPRLPITALLKIINQSNLPVFGILFILWAITSLTLTILSDMPAWDIISVHFLTFTVFTLFAAGASELYILLKDSRWKYHFIVTLFLFIYQGGICLGGILVHSTSLLIFSFPGYLFSMFNNSIFSTVSNSERIQALAFNLFIAIATISGVIYLYYIHLEKTRTLIETDLYKKLKRDN